MIPTPEKLVYPNSTLASLCCPPAAAKEEAAAELKRRRMLRRQLTPSMIMELSKAFRDPPPSANDLENKAGGGPSSLSFSSSLPPAAASEGLDRAEFLAGNLVALNLVSEEHCRALLRRFDELDADGSGRLDEEDMKLFANQRTRQQHQHQHQHQQQQQRASPSKTTKGTPPKTKQLGFGRRESRHLAGDNE